MTAPRYLLVNADDFGLSPGANRGIIAAHEQGIVTSASLMVRWAAAPEAAAYARAHSGLSVGLHLDLGEWVYDAGEWRVAYQVVPPEDADAVTAEVARQLEHFRSLMGRDPTHLDSHQHVHRSEPAHAALLAQARRLGVVLRAETPDVRYCGDFYGQSNKGEPYPDGITVEALVRLLRALPAGTTELGCHPGLDADFQSVYRHERALECETLCDPQVRTTLRECGIVLCSFADRLGCGVAAR